MAFVSFSSQLVLENSTTIPNIFFDEFLPTMSGDVAKVYLFGLHLCGSATRFDNTPAHFSSILGLSEDDIVSAFTHLEDLGLVQILTPDPLEVKYLPLHIATRKLRGAKKGKYDKFNAKLQSVLEGRMITPTEFTEYYTIIESMGLAPDAFLQIAKYCCSVKGKTVGKKYIQTVAKNFAYEGAKSLEAVKLKIKAESEAVALREMAKREKKSGKSKSEKTFIRRSYSEGELEKLDANLDEEVF